MQVGRIPVLNGGPDRLSVTLITTATFCMWLMWVLTWLMQWHPLIVPEKPVKQH